MNERFDTASPAITPAPVVYDVENERDSIDERFDTASHPIAPRSVTSAYDVEEDDSPPPTHFVEIKLPPVAPVETERQAQLDETKAYAVATPQRTEPAPAPRVEPEPAAAPAPPFVAAVAHSTPPLPKISLELPPDSDLVLVETAHPAPTQMSEEPEAPRPRRVRPPRVAVTEEPLQLVETAHKETTPPGA